MGFCIAAGPHSRWIGGPDRLTTGWSEEEQDDSSSEAGVPAEPLNLFEVVTRSYEELGVRCALTGPAVAVRSSAIDEDGQNSSFAGQYDTYLNIRGPEAIVAAVVKCWESASGHRMESYRREHNLPVESLGVAVLVQQLIPAQISGVAFSANPVTGAQDEVMINSTWGLGESVVSGRVTPDTFIIGRPGLQLKDSYVGEKGLMTIIGEQGTAEVKLPMSQQRALTLDSKKAREVSQLALELEQKMGWPVDLEFAYYADELYLLQCRPITTL